MPQPAVIQYPSRGSARVRRASIGATGASPIGRVYPAGQVTDPA
jgi:hypothetical protein